MKLKPQIVFIVIVAMYFLINGFLPREEKWQVDSKNLQEIGYSVQASNHIAKVENGIVPIDAEYVGLMED